MATIEDSYRHKGMRQQLVNTLRAGGFSDERVLAAINEVPRHVFLDSSFMEIARPSPSGRDRPTHSLPRWRSKATCWRWIAA